MTFDGARVAGWIDALAEIGGESEGGVRRLAYSDEDTRAHRWLVERMGELGLEVMVDAHGNLLGLPAACPREAGVVLTGSHIDTVVHAGRYDGVLGTLIALEAVGGLAASCAGRDLWPGVIVFAAEESARFGVGCVGSRLLVGAMAPDEPEALVDARGVTLLAAKTQALAAGYGCRQVDALPLARVRGFLEVHVEQGTELRSKGVPVGIVTAIAAPSRWRVHLKGQQGHSGGSAMDERRDALAAAAEVILLVEREGLERVGAGIRCTAGAIHVDPGLLNTVAGSAQVGLEVRGFEAAAVDACASALQQGSHEIAQRRGIAVRWETVAAGHPYRVPAAMVEHLEAAARAEGIESLRLGSRGAHDAMYMGQRVPAGMLFAMNPTGFSHHPDEAVDAAALQAAGRTLVLALQRMIEGARVPGQPQP